MENLFERINQLVSRGQEAVLVTVVEREGSAPGAPGAKMLVTAAGPTLGTVGGGELELRATARARQALAQRRSELARYVMGEDRQIMEGDQPTGMICGGRATLFFDYLGYAAHFYLLGCGHVGQAVVRHLQGTPFHITVVDHRPEVAAQVQGAHRVLTGDYVAALKEEAVPEGAFFLIVTPSHAYDYVALRDVMAAGWKPRYVGMIGSRQKSTQMVQRMVEELGAEKIDWPALYTPVGLDIGGPSPDEIAVSIVAEMLALYYGKAGHKHMRLPRP